MKRKMYFDLKDQKLKKHKLTFHCDLFNADLTGCNMSCPFCSASMYKYKPTKVVHVNVDEYDEYIGRGTKWGNNFIIGIDGTRSEVIEKYEIDVRNKPYMIHAIKRELKGKALGCHCKPRPCHGDILVKIAEE